MEHRESKDFMQEIIGNLAEAYQLGFNDYKDKKIQIHS